MLVLFHKFNGFPTFLWIPRVKLAKITLLGTASIATVRFRASLNLPNFPFFLALTNSRFLFFMERNIDLFNHGRFLLEGRSLLGIV